MSDVKDSAAIPATEVATKTLKLREPFAPTHIGWDYPALIVVAAGRTVECMPYAYSYAVRDRLDTALGQDSWRERYESPASEYTRCVLEVRYTLGGEWVSRVGLSHRKDLEYAHDEALRNAAFSLGVGRYLRNCIQSVKVVEHEATGKSLEKRPVLPQHALPLEWQYVNREAARKLRDLVNQACKDSAEKKRAVNDIQAIAKLVEKYSIRPDENGHVNLSTLLNWQCTEAMQRVKNWMEDIVAGHLETRHCPVAAAAQQQKAG